MPIPRALTKGHLCPDCRGTGADIARTLARDKQHPRGTGYIVCVPCNGNGLDPAEYFTWSDHKPVN